MDCDQIGRAEAGLPLRTKWRNGTVALIVTAAAILGSINQAAAQNFGSNTLGVQGQFIQPPRSISQMLGDAKRAFEAERYSDVVLLLGDLLAREAVVQEDADLAGQDFFLDADAAMAGVQVSMLREAERMLGELPKAGMEIYELRFGAKAQQLLDEATAKLDRSLLRELSRRYVLTEAGQRGTLLLAELELSEGRPVAAVAILRRLAALPATRNALGDPLLVKLAAAESLAGRDEAAVEHLRAAMQDGLKVELLGAEAKGPDAGEEQAWLEQKFGQLRQQRPAPIDSTWTAHGGAAAVGPGAGHLPLSLLRWEVPTTSSHKQLQYLAEFAAQGGSNVVPPPSWHPIHAGSQILMRTTERMIALDFETGLMIWEYPWTSAPEASDDQAIPFDQFADVDETNELLLQRVWNDLPYGLISSDGQRVFMLNDLTAVEMASLGPLRMRGTRPADTGSNTLVALDIESEGKLLWARGKDGDEPRENNLVDAFFMGPPLAVEGLLYQLAELAGDSYLLCLDPVDGRELWRQQLLANEGASVQNDPVRRVAGAFPAYSDGVLVCPTGSGALVAMDLASRALLWGGYIPRNDASMLLQSRRFSGRGGSDQQGMMDRWASGTPVISDGCVLVTPVESDRIYGYDLLTGKPLWPARLRQQYRYLAGVREGKFLLVSANEVQAFDLFSGQPAWTVAFTLPGSERVSGTGVFGEGTYLLPTTQNAIVEIDLETGQQISRRTTEFPAGNLLAVGDSLISQSATMLAVAYQEDVLRPIVEESLQEQPNSPWAMVRKGELLLQEGKRTEAIEWLLRAREIVPTDEDVRVRLVAALLDSIRSGERPSPEMAELLDGLIELPSQRVELLRLRADDAIAQGKGVAAAALLLEMSEIVLRDERTQRNMQTQFVSLGTDQRATLDAWIAGRLESAIDRMDDSQRAAMEKRVDEHLVPVLGDAPSVQRRALAQFGRFAASDKVANGLFDAAVEDGYWVTAERIAREGLLEAKAQNDQARSDRWRLALVDLYARALFFEDAAKLAEELAEDGNETVSPGIKGLLEEATAPHQWPAGVKLAAREDPVRSRMETSSRNPIDVVSRSGEHMRLWYPLADRDGSVVIRSPYGDQRAIRVEGGRNNNDLVQATIDGGLMILLMPSEIVAVDLLSFSQRPVDAVLWRRPWREQIGTTSVNSRGEQGFFGKDQYYKFVVSRQGEDSIGVMRLGPIVGRRFYLLQGSDLIAIDTTSGEELWRSSGYDDDAFVVAKEGRVAVVSSDSGVQVLREEDGSFVEKRDWDPSEVVAQASGQHVLTSRKEPAADDAERLNSVLRLRDPIAGTEILRTKIDANPNTGSVEAFARRIDGRYLVCLSQNGELVAWDLMLGTEVCNETVNVSGQLTGIHVIPWHDGLIVAAVRREERSFLGAEDDKSIVHLMQGVELVDIDGPLFYVDLNQKKVGWTSELSGPWGITVNQAGGSPLLFLTRAKQSYLDGGKTRKIFDLLAIDTRDGSEAIRVDAFEVDSTFRTLQTETLVMPERDMVDVSLQRYGFMFQFTEEPLPAEQRVIGSEAIRALMEQSQNVIRDGIQAPALIP